MGGDEFSEFSDHVKKRFEYYCHHPEGIAFSGEMLKPSHVIAIFGKVLAEAKANFPLPKEFDYPTYPEALEWFQKWFGSQEVEQEEKPYATHRTSKRLQVDHVKWRAKVDGIEQGEKP